jgi:RHS repeat-associated protein
MQCNEVQCSATRCNAVQGGGTCNACNVQRPPCVLAGGGGYVAGWDTRRLLGPDGNSNLHCHYHKAGVHLSARVAAVPISRLTSISDSGITLDSFSYLGLNTVVKESHPQAGVDLTYIKQTGESNGDAGDQYTGLDRFGRVVDQRWIITASGTATDRFQYGYDRDGNVLYSNNLVNSSFSELYHSNGASNGYDQLNQLTNFARGVLSDTNSDGIPDTISSPTHSIAYSFDALGNWTSVVTDGTSTQTRTANQQNEITSISGQTTPTYDPNGNMTGDQSGHTLIFDAWNRLIKIKNGDTAIQTYSYDALNRRITENPGTLRDLFYSSKWQLLEEDVSGSMQDQYVWSPVYVDALIERDTPTLRVYVQHDLDYNITSLISTAAAVLERYIYDPFGQPTILAPDWSTRGTSSYAWVFLHQGGRFDTVTGLYYFRNRDFSPTLGRWINNDPMSYNAGDMNLYRDESNDPVNRCDPLGLQDDDKPPDYTMPPDPISGNTLGPGDLVVQTCNRPGFDFHKPPGTPAEVSFCKKLGYAIGQGSFWAPGMPGAVTIDCAGSFFDLCVILKGSCRRKKGQFQRITIYGHCGGTGPNRPGPGVMLGKDGPRFDNPSLTPEIIKCIQDALAPNGVLTICACGYQGQQGGWWNTTLGAMANNLQRKVCACPTTGRPHQYYGCSCFVEDRTRPAFNPITDQPAPGAGARPVPKACRKPVGK